MRLDLHRETKGMTFAELGLERREHGGQKRDKPLCGGLTFMLLEWNRVEEKSFSTRG